MALILRSSGSMSTAAATGRTRRRRIIRSFQNMWLILMVFFLQASCNRGNSLGDKKGYCPPSSCGNIQNISYPFRLDTDPPTCGFPSFPGDKSFTLSCHNNSSFLYLNGNNKSSGGGRFLVEGINYDNFTIHLVDPGVQHRSFSSLPISPISSSIYSNPYYANALYRGDSGGYVGGPLSRVAVLISCDRKQIYNSDQIYNGISFKVVENTAHYKTNSKVYSYMIVGYRDVALEQVMESCSIDMITLLPLTNPNDMEETVPSYQEFRSLFSDGFHLSWINVYCQSKCLAYGTCLIDSENGSPTCYLPHRHIPFNIIHFGYTMRDSFKHKILPSFAMFHGAVTLLGSPCVFAFLIYKWRRRHLSQYDMIEEFLQNHNDLMPIRYSYSEIKKITAHFKDKLGEGGFGCVYKGKLRSGNLAAIKILGKSSKVTNGQDFMNEVATIGRIHHVNVVQLVGYCAEGSKRALVYDFMPNGSLDKYIFSKPGYVSLSWKILYEISIGVARGIEYLHRGCDMQILHFDIKPHNILLNESFIPKVSDFGLAKLYPTMKDTIASLTSVRGTIGYMAPELFYKNIGRTSYKADVYSFGMLLLEIAGKRKNLNPGIETEKLSQIYFPSWVHDQISNGEDMKIEDGATEEETIIVKKMVIVGLWCIQMNPDDRPSMNEVVEMLEGDSENLQIPPKPALCPNEMPNVAERKESSHKSDDSSD